MTRFVFCFVVVLLLAFSNSSYAQYSETLSDQYPGKGAAVSAQSKKAGGDTPVPVQVKIQVKDSTLDYIVKEIARQSNLRVVYRDVGNVLTKRTTVSISGMEPMAAFDKILEGTGLVATRANGNVIGIRPIVDTASKSAEGGTGVVGGRVVDSVSRVGIKGVTLTVVGTGVSAVSDEGGNFVMLRVPEGNQTITARLMGYRSRNSSVLVKAGTRNSLQFIMASTATSLSEVVTTATGQQRRIEVGNDIVKLNANDILEKTPARSVSDMLRYAQVPGVQVQTASGEIGAPTRILMRGIGSISQTTDPAVIVDGVWVSSDMSSENVKNKATASAVENGRGRTRYSSNPLDAIDPSNIESIEIIRGPSAASLYGQEAANGVIVVTTKRGQPGQTSWTYSGSLDWDTQTRAKFNDYVSFGTGGNGIAIEGCNIQAHYDLLCRQDSVFNLNQFKALLEETGPASSYRNSLSVRGGVPSVTYSLSATFQDQVGTERTVPADLIRLRNLKIPYGNDLIKPTGQKQLFLSSALGFTPSNALNFDISMNVSNTDMKQNSVFMQGGLADFMGYWDTLGVFRHGGSEVEVKYGGTSNFAIQSSARARYHTGSWWSLIGQIGMDKQEREDYQKLEQRDCPYGVCQPANVKDGLKRYKESSNVFTGRVSASGVVGTRFDRFLAIRPSIGLDFKRTMRKGITFGLNETPFGADNASGAGTGGISGSDIVTAGYFFNTTLKVLDRMHFDIGWRQDAGSIIRSRSSSRFPKLGTSWLVSDEGFFPENKFLNLLRLRGAVGYASVHPDAADLYGAYRFASANVDGSRIIIANLGTIGNNKLLPERSMEYEAGFDAGFWEDRAEVIFTIAHKDLRNAIINRNLPLSAGPSSAVRKENIARVANRSLELSINTRAIDNDAMLLQLSAGISNVNNVIKRLGENSVPTSNTQRNRLVEGYQIGSIWEKPVLGYGDSDNNGYIDQSEILLGDTTVYMGWAQPKYSASYRVSLSMLNRNLTVSTSLAHTGPRIQNMRYHDNYGLTVLGASLEEQAIARANAVTGGTVMSVSDIRLTSASINYNLPLSFSSRLNAKLISVSLQGSNLGLWTNYSGRDPMINSTPIGNVISDNGFTLPIPRRYALNVSIRL